MAHGYRYDRKGLVLEYYTETEWQSSSPPPSSEQPPAVREFVPILHADALTFADGVPDLRGFPVNTPNGDQLGIVSGFLADAANEYLPYLYVSIGEGRQVVVPSSQVTIYADRCLVILDGGKPALENAPSAHFAPADAEHADKYWRDLRWRNAA